MRFALHQTIARYVLGFIYLFGAVDGVLEMGFGIYLTGESDLASFHGQLQHTLYFWGFLKLVEALGAISLLLNIKPAFGAALLAPITSVLCLFYVFDLHWYYAVVVLAVVHLIVLHAYRARYAPMFADYPTTRARQRVVTAPDAVIQR